MTAEHKETFFKRGTEALCRDLVHTSARPTKREECGHNLLSLSAPHRLINRVQSEVAYHFASASPAQMLRVERAGHTAL